MLYTIPLIILTIITLINYFDKNNYIFNYIPKQKHNLKVSVLIPAKNEINRIGQCLSSLQIQDYPNIEIIVLDDDSDDGTYDFVSENFNVNIIRGMERPQGWVGKNWACFQLANQANGDIIIFTDADNYFERSAISKSVGYLIENNYDMMSVFPEIHNESISERVFVPLVDNILTSFLPLSLVRKTSEVSLSAANGQWIIIKKDVYFSIGGHEKVKNNYAEDISLAKLLKENKYKISTLLGRDLIYTRMYTNFNEIYNGFSKNMYYMMGGNIFSNLIFILFLISIHFHIYNPELKIYFFAIYTLYITLQTGINGKFSFLTFFTFLPRYYFVIIMTFISFFKIKTNKVKWRT